jgi:hypothetical protein
MIKERGANTFELESLSSDMFAPLTEREASLVVGGVDTYYYASYSLVASGTDYQFNNDGSVTQTDWALYRLSDAGVINVY